VAKVEIPDVVQDYLIDKGREYKLNPSQRGVIIEMLRELEEDPSKGRPVPVPLGGPLYVERHIGENIWATIHYDIRKYRSDTTVYITAIRLGYKI